MTAFEQWCNNELGKEEMLSVASASKDDKGVLAVPYLEQQLKNQPEEVEVCVLASASKDKVRVLAVIAFE